MRAINMAGHARVTMSDVRKAFATAGCRKVRTYIQNRNLIFESPARDRGAIVRQVESKLQDTLSEKPVIVLRSLTEIEGGSGKRPSRPLKRKPASSGTYVVFLS